MFLRSARGDTIGLKKYTYEGTNAFFERQKTRFICKFWSISMLRDPYPDPHSQYGSGSGYRIQVDPDPDSQHCKILFLFQLVKVKYLSCPGVLPGLGVKKILF